MTNTEQFWEYANKTLLLALCAELDGDLQGLLELAQTCTRTVVLERQLPDRSMA
jgi:hypothetical protein